MLGAMSMKMQLCSVLLTCSAVATCGLMHGTAAVQALSLVPNAAKPFVPYKPRAFCTQQQRQQVANKLLGSYLVLLLKELVVPPEQQRQVSHCASSSCR